MSTSELKLLNSGLSDCVIHPIPLFEFDIDKSLFTYGLNFGQVVRLTTYAWYISGTEKRIMVDAGGTADTSSAKGFQARELQTLDFGLSKLGISLADIDLVILTHLHYDHVEQACQYPRARFLVQKDELEFALNPHPSFARGYTKEFFNGLNFEVVNGDTQVCEEISVLRTPGHTPGGQSVRIKTAQGTAIISGLCTIRDNFQPTFLINKSMPVTYPGIRTNTFDAYDSLVRIKKMADIIVPNHDPEFLHVETIPCSPYTIA